MQDRDKLYIDGAWVPSTGSGTIDVVNATTEEVMGRVPEGTPDDPPAHLRQLVAQTVTAWDQPRARRALSLRLREGLTAGPAGAELLDAIEQTLAQLGELFAAWRQQGLVQAPAHISPRQLAWELLAPVAYIRLLHLHGSASLALRRAGRRLVNQHLDFFLAAVFGTTPDGQAASRPERSG